MTQQHKDDALARAKGKHLIVYDGVCGLCNGFVKFVIQNDKRRNFVFTPLQSEVGAEILAAHGCEAGDLNTVYLVCDVGTQHERVLSKSHAAFKVLQTLGGICQIVALGRFLGPVVGNIVYDMIAANRYKVFGKSDACMMPSPEVRELFLEM